MKKQYVWIKKFVPQSFKLEFKICTQWLCKGIYQLSLRNNQNFGNFVIGALVLTNYIFQNMKEYQDVSTLGIWGYGEGKIISWEDRDPLGVGMGIRNGTCGHWNVDWRWNFGHENVN